MFTIPKNDKDGAESVTALTIPPGTLLISVPGVLLSLRIFRFYRVAAEWDRCLLEIWKSLFRIFPEMAGFFLGYFCALKKSRHIAGCTIK